MKTSTGFEYELQDNAMDDWFVMKYLRNIDKGESQFVVDLLPALLGEEQAEALEEHLMKVENKVKLTSVCREIGEILQSGKETKN